MTLQEKKENIRDLWKSSRFGVLTLSRISNIYEIIFSEPELIEHFNRCFKEFAKSGEGGYYMQSAIDKL